MSNLSKLFNYSAPMTEKVVTITQQHKQLREAFRFDTIREYKRLNPKKVSWSSNQIYEHLAKQKKYNDFVALRKSNAKILETHKAVAPVRKQHVAATKIANLFKYANRRGTVSLQDSAFRSYYRYVFNHRVLFPLRFDYNLLHRLASQYVDMFYMKTHRLVLDTLQSHKSGVKIYGIFAFICNIVNDENHGEQIIKRNTGSVIINDVTEYHSFLRTRMYEILDEILQLPYMDVRGIDHSDLNVIKFNLSLGGSYKPLPVNILNTKSIINIQNEDEKCFMWCMIASQHLPAKNAERVKQYQKNELINEWKFSDNTPLPMPINKIQYFERLNNIAINVYGLDEYKVNIKIPLKISKNKSDKIVNLFFHDNHYSLIKNFSRFCGEGIYACPRCLRSYKNDDCYKRHLADCENLNENGSLCVMPKNLECTNKKTGQKFTVKPSIKFDKFANQKRLPVVIYADFEASLVDCPDHKMKNVTTKHIANSFRLHIQSDVDLGIPLDYEYCGMDSDYKFIELLVRELEGKIQDKLSALKEQNEKPNLSTTEEVDFQKATMCRFCNKKFKTTDIKVRDHNHYTGLYEGAAHQDCNVKACQRKNVSIPVVFHNANYDIRCFISAFEKIKGNGFVNSISGLPCNMEIYKSLNINTFVIIDSYAHLTSSLDKLVKNLPAEKKIRLRSIVATDEQFELVCKKGLYPYEKIQSVGGIHFPISELVRSDFDSKLCLSKIDDDGWNHVQKVITTFGFTDFKQYHDLYLKIDVLGLADVFEYHRELSQKVYGLDPAHYIGLPQMTWQAGLKFTGVVLEQLTDQDMYCFFERAKRGGVSVISHKHGAANNKYLPNHDPTKESSYLLQVDCNNLYGWAMCEKLPTGDFEWITSTDVTEEDIRSYDVNKDLYGYFLEVDLEYPAHLHDAHNDYPLAPEHLTLGQSRKLAPNLNDKKNYVVHIENLRYYLEKGMILTNIHRGVRFIHSTWLKSYIDNNSARRQQAKNDFEKDYFKLMNNAFYGKTMENVRDRVNIHFCLNKESFDKRVSSPLFADQIHVINPEGLALVKCHRRKVVLDKPIYIGATVLDFSKLLMYKFHYDTMKISYPHALMLKTDTDSLLYHINTDDLYAEMKTDVAIQSKMEFSNYPKDHLLFNTDRKKVPGFFQDECVDSSMAIIQEYVGLRAKSYANKLYYPELNKHKEKQKGKGVPSRHLAQRVTFADYKTCLETSKPLRLDNIYSFRSNKLKTYSTVSCKIALSSGDDKRIPVTENSPYTYAIGHYKTKV